MKLEASLSFSQAPPILVPFRFFLSAPLFGLLAALLALWYGPSLMESRWQPAVLALTHMMTLGFLGMAMVGAMMQMLPVVAGSPVAHPVGVARTVHVLLVPGVLLLAGGFLFGVNWPMRIAMVLLGSGFTVFAVAVGLSLKRASAANPTVVGMRYAVGALVVTVSLGLTLASNYGWDWWLIERVRLTNLHLTWGLLGWVGLLVAGVSYQVVPMFQLTPSYPKLLTRWLTTALFVLLLLLSVAYWLPVRAQDKVMLAAGLAVASIFTVFAIVTLRLQLRRRRKQSDVTLLFWRFGMSCLLLALVLGVAGQVMPVLDGMQGDNIALAFLFIAGFAVSVVNGMLYKIVPFLIWFHLQSLLMGVVRVPNMKLIMPEVGMRRQMWLHFAAVPALALSVIWPPLIYPAALLFGASMVLLEVNLLNAFRIYQQNAKLAPKGDSSST
ncbi:hypothetical protein SCD_n00461 [Sulfuricella denitrificans skB26]|uniref:Transmembrane protein n=1 Tax=Sulfuricella denitrificans (strain DSM 22764 / NBRC 105220 / skB26) TaxID=1163617 RepID=S6A9L3_SULDS|nr:hypothetical protein [Sulfuricella denitrificans]BAN34310.1 hypothetical protein SCD_n00461 [Sulfuricella denitrificans skB26]